ncbi:Vomeronasal type-1 receptor 4 [Galemys pyrenaicus]|uniref:Vomeronasal type-1 receptor 4 n=1 Tax=Galemys pyrenaicus TaxID=202257 RepID=A0A8J6AKR9_GALPY|nr:Vomeronasal type-1 receptor 4 [Galemys pyrenaicus]
MSWSRACRRERLTGDQLRGGLPCVPRAHLSPPRRLHGAHTPPAGPGTPPPRGRRGDVETELHRPWAGDSDKKGSPAPREDEGQDGRPDGRGRGSGLRCLTRSGAGLVPAPRGHLDAEGPVGCRPGASCALGSASSEHRRRLMSLVRLASPVPSWEAAACAFQSALSARPDPSSEGPVVSFCCGCCGPGVEDAAGECGQADLSLCPAESPSVWVLPSPRGPRVRDLEVVGTLANAVLFLHHVPVLCGPRQTPPSTVLPHLAVANVLVLLCTGTPHLLAVWVSRTPLSSLGCKLVIFLQRMARGTTLCSTCLLSTSQRLTLSPGRLGWTVLRGGLPRVLGPSCCTCWLLSALINVHLPVIVTGPGSPSNVSAPQGRWFCSDLDPRPAIVILWLVPDAVFLGLMGWASVSMALLLRRHQHRVRHLHTPRPTRGSSPETRATHAVLRLTVTFVGFYLLNSVLSFYMAAFVDTRLWVVQVSNLLGCCFPSVCPFLMALRGSRRGRLFL